MRQNQIVHEPEQAHRRRTGAGPGRSEPERLSWAHGHWLAG